MKLNEIKYQVRQLTYVENSLVNEYIWEGPFYDLYEVELFISICKVLDRNQPECECFYIVEVVPYE